MRFREHRGSLAESMETVIEIADREALIKHCRDLLAPYKFEFEPDAFKVELYSGEPDRRIDWKKTYIVSIENYGVMGFTDDPCGPCDCPCHDHPGTMHVMPCCEYTYQQRTKRSGPIAATKSKP